MAAKGTTEVRRGAPGRGGPRYSGAIEGYGPARSFASDVRAMWLVVNHFRYRALQRAFGIPDEEVNVVTLILAGLIVTKAYDKAEKLLHAPGGPTRADLAFGAATGREGLYDILGPWSRQTPGVAGLLALAVIGARAAPTVRASAHDLRVAGTRLRASFNRRYGYVLPWLEPKAEDEGGASGVSTRS
jgi:hypothetical protein